MNLRDYKDCKFPVGMTEHLFVMAFYDSDRLEKFDRDFPRYRNDTKRHTIPFEYWTKTFFATDDEMVFMKMRYSDEIAKHSVIQFSSVAPPVKTIYPDNQPWRTKGRRP